MNVWGEIPSLSTRLGRDKTAQRAGLVPELSHDASAAGGPPCSGGLDQPARPAEGAASKTPRSGARRSITGHRLGTRQAYNPVGGTGISSLVGGRPRAYGLW